MYLGRYRQGEWVVLRGQKITPVSGSATYPYPQYDAVDPDRLLGPKTHDTTQFTGGTNPVVQVYDKEFNKVAEKEMWPEFPVKYPAIFKASLFLGSDIPEGICTSITTYTNYNRIGGVLNSQGMVCSFEVLPGGHASGSYIAMHYLDLPHAKFVLGQHDSDSLDFRKNPKV